MNRQQMKELARRHQRIQASGVERTEALVMGWKIGMDAPDTNTVDVRCWCGKTFRFSAAPIEPEFGRANLEQGAATTSPWATGACPDCQRIHRVRTTIVVIVEEEKKSEHLIATGAGDTIQA